jgi:hypothetical protein
LPLALRLLPLALGLMPGQRAVATCPRATVTIIALVLASRQTTYLPALAFQAGLDRFGHIAAGGEQDRRPLLPLGGNRSRPHSVHDAYSE